MTDPPPRQTAVVTDWLTVRGGAARVIEVVLDVRPEASVHTLVYDERALHGSPIAARPVRTSFLQRLPFIRKSYRTWLPLMPAAIERLDVRHADLVISLSHAVASGVLTGADQLHISYVFTPVRYGWDLHRDYLDHTRSFAPIGVLRHAALHYLRLWDRAASCRPDVMVAASHYVARRISKIYGRTVEVIHPPVEVDRFQADRTREPFYLTVSRLVPYKRVDLIARAFRRLDRPLVIIGDGPERRRIERLAGGRVRLLGWQSDEIVTSYLERCRAFVFAADEDFGIAPVEALAAGAPVIAFGKGGVLETVTPGYTGVFFDRQEVDSVCRAVADFESMTGRFPPALMRQAAEPFGPIHFRHRFEGLIDREWQRFSRQRAARRAVPASYAPMVR